MYYDYENKIVKDVFTEQELADIYAHVNSTPDEQKKFVDYFSHTAHLTWMPDHIVSAIEKRMAAEHDEDLVLRELSFARYSKEQDNIAVQLTPHRDESFEEGRITFDIQVGSNVSWPLVVEGKEFTLEDNQALLFAGTHQVHWRTKREFETGEHVDMIFCHFSSANWENEDLGNNPNVAGMGDHVPETEKPASEHHVRMQEKVDYWTDKYNTES